MILSWKREQQQQFILVSETIHIPIVAFSLMNAGTKMPIPASGL